MTKSNKCLFFTDGNATFTDLEIPETVSNGQLGANCATDATAVFLSYSISDAFNVHPYPRTGRVRDATAAFTYTGSIDDISDVIASLEATMGATAPARYRRSAQPAPSTYKITMEDMASWPDME